MHDTKVEALRAKLDVGKPAIAIAAHNPLVAKLATEAGLMRSGEVALNFRLPMPCPTPTSCR